MCIMFQQTFRALQHGLRRHGFAPIPYLSGVLNEVEEVVGRAGVLLMEGETVSVRINQKQKHKQIQSHLAGSIFLKSYQYKYKLKDITVRIILFKSDQSNINLSDCYVGLVSQNV